MRSRRLRWVVLGASTLALAVWFLPKLGSRVTEPADPTPLIVQRIQGLGKLTSAEMAVQRVYEFERHMEPTGFWKSVPGLDWAVAKTTRNEALMSAHATITASIDLRGATVAQTDTGWLVTLPPAKLDMPKVTAKLHSMRPGAFWKHHGLPLDASEAMGRWTVDAAQQQGLALRAQKEAEATLRQLLHPMTGPNLTIRFADAS